MSSWIPMGPISNLVTINNPQCPSGSRCVNGVCVPIPKYERLSEGYSLQFEKQGEKIMIRILKLGNYYIQQRMGELSIKGIVVKDYVLITNYNINGIAAQYPIEAEKELDLCRSEDPVCVEMGFELLKDKIKNL